MSPVEPRPSSQVWIKISIVVFAAAIVLSVIGSLLIAWRFSPRPSAVAASAQDAREACKKASRKLLRQPVSAEWIDADKWKASDDASGRWTVVMQYRLTGKNGASKLGTANCIIQHERSVNEWRLSDFIEN